ncbi:hypothetical protein WAJ24_21505, partial [Acinetobacter baumannii]
GAGRGTAPAAVHGTELHPDYLKASSQPAAPYFPAAELLPLPAHDPAPQTRPASPGGTTYGSRDQDNRAAPYSELHISG